MGRKDIESTLNEVRILCSIENEYVVGYKDAFLAKKDSELCIGKPHLKFSDFYLNVINFQTGRKFWKDLNLK